MITKCSECTYANDGFCLRSPPVWSGERGDFPNTRWKQPRTPEFGCGEGVKVRPAGAMTDCDRWRDSFVEPFPLAGRFRIAASPQDIVCEISNGTARIVDVAGHKLMTRESMSAAMEGLAVARFWRPVSNV